MCVAQKGVKMFILWIMALLVIKYISPSLSACNYPPAVNYMESEIRASPPFAEGSTMNYSCLSGYESYGSRIFTCLNGHWHGYFNCTIRKCPSLKPPDHGRFYNPCREVACDINFFCNDGYQRVGSENSYCRVNGSWSHAVPECQIITCPSPPVIEHGNLNLSGGGLNVYGSELSVKCNEGFIRSGASRIYCASNGQWTQAPVCLPSNCSAYPSMDGKCIKKTKVLSLRDGRFLLFIYCTENATVIRTKNDAATCSNGRWNDLPMGCYCDCKVNINSEGVLFENFNTVDLLKHGETLKWSCKDGYTKATSDLLTCDDGVIETPKCLPNTESESKIVTGNFSHIEAVILLAVIPIIIIPIIIIAITIIRKRKWVKLPCTCNGKDKRDEESSIPEGDPQRQSLLSAENKDFREHNGVPKQVAAKNIKVETTDRTSSDGLPGKMERQRSVASLKQQFDDERTEGVPKQVAAKNIKVETTDRTSSDGLPGKMERQRSVASLKQQFDDERTEGVPKQVAAKNIKVETTDRTSSDGLPGKMERQRSVASLKQQFDDERTEGVPKQVAAKNIKVETTDRTSSDGLPGKMERQRSVASLKQQFDDERTEGVPRQVAANNIPVEATDSTSCAVLTETGETESPTTVASRKQFFDNLAEGK